MQILTELKGKIAKNTIIVGGFNTPFLMLDRSSRQNPYKETVNLNNVNRQTDLTDINKHSRQQH